MIKLIGLKEFSVRFWWRLLRYRAWRSRRVIVLLFALMLWMSWIAATQDTGVPNNDIPFGILVATALIVTIPTVLLYITILYAWRGLLISLIAGLSIVIFSGVVARNLGVQIPSEDMVNKAAYFAIAGSLWLTILFVRLPFPVAYSARVRIEPPPQTVFGDESAVGAIFNTIRPSRGSSFPDPSVGLTEARSDGVFETNRVEGSNGAIIASEIAIIREAPPDQLELQIEVYPPKRKRTESLRQRWRFKELGDKVEVRISQSQRATFMNLITFYLLDGLGDWLAAVGAWIGDSEMLSDYGRRTNRAVGRF